MTSDGLLVLALLLTAVILFASERWRVDFIALGVMIALMVSGIITPAEGVAGFVNPATITIAAMLVLSAGLQHTGALNELAERIVQTAGHSETRLLITLMLTVALISAFVLNTAVVAVFIPLVLKIGDDLHISPSRLLMPLSFASMLGGTLTLIGTSTNLLVAGIAQKAGVYTFRMLDFTPLGIIVLLAGLAYILLIGRRLIPARQGEGNLLDKYGVREYLSEVVVLPESPLVGKRLVESDLGARFDITVLDILREGRTIHLPGSSRHFRPGDVILVRAPLQQLLAVQESEGLAISPLRKLAPELLEKRESVALAEVVVAPHSSLVGHSFKEVNFRQRFGAVAVGIQRRGQPVFGKLGHESLMAGDMLLLLGRPEAMVALRQSPDFLLLLDVPLPARRRQASWAVGVMAAVVLATFFDLLPVMVSALAGAFALVLFGVIDLDEAYAALDKRVLVMLGGILSLEAAMEHSGLAQWLANHVVDLLGPSHPWLLVAAFYFMAMMLTEAMSNQATAVVLAPLAISTAQALGASPVPFLMAVTFAASASFMTPVGYQTNTMVYGVGGYRFLDFTRVGAPLNLLLWILSSLFIPIIWPL
ncbi:MAG: SLC13 family permease [Caldilineales bacterium]|nr:SLC13 family permease [Caldilineales bacterium]